MKAEVVFRDSLTQLGEGPVWDERMQSLLWVDIMRSVVHRFDPVTGENQTLHVGNMISCLAPIRGQLYIAASRDGIGYLDLEQRRFKSIVDPEKNQVGNRFNDGKCDPGGSFWVGSMALNESRGKGALYRLDGYGKVSRIIDGVSISNGLAWSNDGNHMFYIDSLAYCIMRYSWVEELSNLTSGHILCKIDPSEGAFDGMTIDSEDRLWVAVYGGKKVLCIDGQSGKTLHEIQVDTSFPSSCTFGGEDYQTLFITSIALKAPKTDPNKGALFAVRPGAMGMPPASYRPLKN